MTTPVQATEELEPPLPHQEAWARRLAEVLWVSPGRITAAVVLCLLPAVGYVFVDLPNVTNAILSASFIAIALLIARRAPQYRLVVAFLSVCVSMRYMYWRASETLSGGDVLDVVLGLLLFAAEVYAVMVLVAGYFQTAIIRRRSPIELDPADPSLPWVDVFIPSYNEPVDVVRSTVLGAMAMEYANKRIYVLDDGRREEFQRLCLELGVGYRKRPDNSHAKAGNINTALQTTQGDLVAIFDADHVPVRSFLTATVGFFLMDERVALVQTPHHFYNPDPFQRNLFLEGQVPPEQHLFYHGVQLGNDFWNSAFFCGSCAVLRRIPLEDVGGIAVETVTEDAHTALKMHAAGWQSVFLELPLAAGLATESFAAHIGQRIRWARGMAQIFRLDNPLLKKGLSLAQRLNYFNASWHFFHGVPRLIFLISPAAYLIFDIHPVNANVREVLLFAVPHLVLAGIGTALTNRNVRHSFWPEVYEVAIAPYSALVTTIALLAPRRGAFNVTDKGVNFSRISFSWRAARPHIVLFSISVIAMMLTPEKMASNPLDRDTIWVAVVWNAYNIFMLLAVLMAAVERPQRRRHYRIPRRCPARLSAGGVVLDGHTINLSLGGFALELAGEEACPERFALTLSATDIPPVTLPAEALYVTQRDGVTEVRGRFDRLAAVQEHQLSEVLFSAADSWMDDDFVFDSPLRSALSLLATPLVVMMRRPSLIQRLRGLWRRDEDEVAPLIPALVGPAGESLPLPLRPARRGWSPMTGPVVLMVFALSLAVGWTPMVQLFTYYLPTQRWQGVSFKTRLSELGQAYDELKDRFAELKNARRNDRPLPADWTSELWGVRRDYALYGDGRFQPDHATVEAALDAALLAMVSAEREYREDASDAVLDARFESIETNLQIAAERLGTFAP